MRSFLFHSHVSSSSCFFIHLKDNQRNMCVNSLDTPLNGTPSNYTLFTIWQLFSPSLKSNTCRHTFLRICTTKHCFIQVVPGSEASSPQEGTSLQRMQISREVSSCGKKKEKTPLPPSAKGKLSSCWDGDLWPFFRELTGVPLNSHPRDKLAMKRDLLLGRGPSIHTTGILFIPHAAPLIQHPPSHETTKAQLQKTQIFCRSSVT